MFCKYFDKGTDKEICSECPFNAGTDVVYCEYLQEAED
jgi:hypothetical protein